MYSITPRQHAIILQERCKASIGGAMGSLGKLIIGPLKQLEKNRYYFDISEEDEFEFRGRMRKEKLWSATVHVNQHDVSIDEHDTFGEMPHGVLRCVSAPIAGSDYRLLHR